MGGLRSLTPGLQQRRLQELRRQVAAAEAEQQRLEALLEQVSSIHEQAFRRRVEPLLQHRQGLEQQQRLLQAALLQPGLMAAGNATAADGEGRASQASIPVGNAPPTAAEQASAPQRRRQHLVLWGCVVAAGLAALVLPQTVRQQQTVLSAPHATPTARSQGPIARAVDDPSRNGPHQPADLVVLRSQGGPSWLEVRDVGNRVLWAGLLTGVQRFPLGRGLRVAAGRPDLVLLEQPPGPSRPLGRVEQIGWQWLGPQPAGGEAGG